MESEWFIIAKHLSVVTRNVQVYGVLNCVSKLNTFLVTFSHLLNKMNNSNKMWRRVYCYDTYEPSFPITCSFLCLMLAAILKWIVKLVWIWLPHSNSGSSHWIVYFMIRPCGDGLLMSLSIVSCLYLRLTLFTLYIHAPNEHVVMV